MNQNNNPLWPYFKPQQPKPLIPLKFQPQPKPNLPLFIKKRVYISFDWDNDRNYRHLLMAWNKNPKFSFVYYDHTATGINSLQIAYIKSKLLEKIKSASHVLVIVGEHANDLHRDRMRIGHINWINWEINKAKELNKKLVGVKINKVNQSPHELMGVNAKWAMSFTQEAILKALSEA